MEAVGVEPPERFACQVDDVMPDIDHKSLRCRSAGVVNIRVSGTPPTINVGDVVSVPLAGVRRDPDGVLFKRVTGKNVGWIVDTDGAMLKVDVPAACPTLQEILASGGGASFKH
jgi:hypothetical protein